LDGVKLLKRKGCGDAYLWHGYHAGDWGRVGEGVDFFAAVETEDSASQEEQRDVRAYFGGYFEACWARKCYA
jgi:hypothetical protein